MPENRLSHLFCQLIGPRRAACAIAICLVSAGFADDRQLAELANLYREAQGSAKVYRWDFKYSRLVVPRPSLAGGGSLLTELDKSRVSVDLFSIAGSADYSAAGSIVADSQRYNLSVGYSAPRTSGDSDRISVRSQRCFDGAIFGSVNRSLPGAELPRETSLSDDRCNTVADIGAFTQEKREFDLQIGNSGLCAMMPRFPTPFLTDTHFMEFGDFIETFSTKTKDEFACWKDDAGLFRLNAWVSREGSKTEARYCYWIFSDGRVDRIEVQLKDGTVFKTCEFKYTGITPESVVAMDWINGRGFRIELTKFSQVTELADNSFRVTLPDGALVNDLDKGIQYTAGATTEAEALELAEFAKMNKLAPIHGRSGWFAVTISCAALLAITTCFWIWRKRSLSAVAFVWASGTLLGLPHECCAEEPYWDGKSWKVDVGAAGKVSIRQCGYSAAAIVLNILSTDFDPVLLAQELKPTPDGIRMDRLKSILIGHGLVVDGYNSSISRVIGGLRNGEVAILAISKYGVNNLHYVVIASDISGRTLFIDYPREPADLDSWSSAEKKTIDKDFGRACNFTVGFLGR